MSGDKYGASEMVIPSTPSKPKFGTRVKNHFRRFWWAHVIAFIAIVLVVVLPVYVNPTSRPGGLGLIPQFRIYVGYPNIAQHDVNDSTVTVKEISITDPTPNSFHLNQTQTLGTDSIFHPHFFAFNATASLAGSSDPFAVVTIPDVKGVDGAVINVDQDVHLDGNGAFADFSTAIMMNEEVDMILYGRPELKQGSLPTITVTYNKTVTIKGSHLLPPPKQPTQLLTTRQASTSSKAST